MRIGKKQLLIGIITVLFWGACKNKPHQPGLIVRDSTINKKTSFNNLFLDSSALENFLIKYPEFKVYEKQYLDFYKQRNYEYAWFDSSGLAEQSQNFINLLTITIEELQDSSLYNKRLMKLYQSLAKDSIHNTNKKDVLKTELLLTGQFFDYASKVYKGSDIDAAELGWFIPRKKVDLTAALDSTLKSKGKEPDSYEPRNFQYKKLQEYLVKYFELEKKIAGQWDSIPLPGKPLKKKDYSLVISKIKRRLWLLGDMAVEDSSQRFDSTLLSACKRFQRRMGLSIDGVIGARMIQELNVTPAQRIRQLLVNMERARWMPPERDTVNYIMVNIPEYKMHVYDSGKLMFDMKVIVGKSTNSTVIFNGNLQYIVFSPYWNVPISIVKSEIVPMMAKDKDYLKKNNMEITGRSNGWPTVRQKPGGNNSLGLVKFLFPNNYDIYFHDTPNHELFNASTRSFSHGCIRLGDPKKFAQYLLRGDTATTWKSEVIDSCMHLQTEKWVTLKKKIPVFIVYFTAWVEKDGLLNFRKDIYGHDEKMSAKLFVKK